MKGKVLQNIKKQHYLVALENGEEVEAYIGLKPLVLVFGGQLAIGQIVSVKLVSENQWIISPRDPNGS